MDCSTPGLPVHHQLPELTQTLSIEAMMPSKHLIRCCPLSPPAFNLSQHQGLFQWVSPSHQVAKGLEFQHQSFQWIYRTNFLFDWLVWSPCRPRESQESTPTPQFKSINSSALSFLYSPNLIDLEKAKEPEIKLPTSAGSSKKQQNSRKTSTSV